MGRYSVRAKEERSALAPGREAAGGAAGAAAATRAHTVWRLLREGSGEVAALGVGAVVMLASTGAALAVPALFGRVIDSLQARPAAPTPAEAAEAAAALARNAAALVAASVASAVLSAAQSLIFSRAGERIIAGLRRRVFRALIEQECGFFDVSRTQELVSRLGGDTAMLKDAATSQLVAGMRQALPSRAA